MVSLPTLVPAPTDTTVYRPLVGDKFQYALNSDSVVWDRWVYAVEVDTTFYNVSVVDTANAKIFSEFLIYFKCNTLADKDACCLVSEYDGTVCMVPKTTGTVMETFRFTNWEWNNVVLAAPGADFLTDADSNGTVNGADYWHGMNSLNAYGFAPVAVGYYNNYQDSLNCAATTTNVAYQFTCTGWQVHYDATGPRYPRFGKDEKLWAGFIDAASTQAASFTEVSLEGGFNAIAAGLTGLAAAFLVAF